MRFQPFSFLSLFFLLVFSCSAPSNKTELVEVEEEKVLEKPAADSTDSKSGATYSGDNSQTSLDWNGTYFGVLPCASCEGIETWVTLNSDGTFDLKTHYLGLNDAREEIFTGNFSWDKTGSMVSLEGLIGNYPGKYKVGENQIWHLDRDGNRISGDLADRYILKKK
ncbi:putative lipoprotein NlpE involved in copper resistance [Algoriphagus boseongensis]|uniref:Putative lipoprotein NlpE involved in copper resistance n=1 Tax=Algoriphagus boseongensis TaxID=1442587 RepID=A0A4V3D240_9BACT|nr:copper resistance protein NlpE [Algoriphagus boseongensis]TDQ16910.1 putative lipoprotein NlpE involved in copper resistance [Algoriphagus boseongensis]